MANKDEKFDYRALSAELDQIIDKLQDDETSIDEAIDLYEKGVHLTQKLEHYLKSAENRLIKVANNFKE